MTNVSGQHKASDVCDYSLILMFSYVSHTTACLIATRTR